MRERELERARARTCETAKERERDSERESNRHYKTVSSTRQRRPQITVIDVDLVIGQGFFNVCVEGCQGIFDLVSFCLFEVRCWPRFDVTRC